jgi:predicted site-specific integrase-resolvase
MSIITGGNNKPSIDPQAVYSREEAAMLLGVSLSSLKKLINAGYLRVSKPANMRRVFIKGENILAMLDQTVVERNA